jgi:cytochrome c oxidase assembly protein subunit 15
MTAVDLYNLSPLAQLLVLGALVAVPPLAWVLWTSRGQSTAGRLHTLTVVTLFLTFDLVLFGAFTRLTDSGLGCPDWPGCYGHASPVGASAPIEQAQTLMPTGPVTAGKAWVEMVHRYLASGVGALILTLAGWTWWARRTVHLSPWWPTATLLWVCLQGAFGALTVTMKLFPAIVTLHLLGGLVLLWLLRTQALGYAAHLRPHAPSGGAPLSRAVLRGWRTVFALVWVQVALGGWVSTNYAVMACSDFPSCQGGWWPTMSFAHGFEFWRALGHTGAGDALPFEALTAIHYTHRLAAYAVLTGVVWLAWVLWRVPGQQRTARGLAVLAAWQLLTGLSNVLLGWPLLGAVAHTGGAAGLILVLAGVRHGVAGVVDGSVFQGARA